MYEQQINDLSAMFGGKREKAKQYLIEAIRKEPYNLTTELLNAPEKAWPYVSEIIKSNPQGVFLAVLRLKPDARAERFLNETGYGGYIPMIREFNSLRGKVEAYRENGIPLQYDDVNRAYMSGKVKEALKGMKQLAVTGRGLEQLLNRWRKLKSLADKAGESIPDIRDAVKRLDVEECQRILNSIDEAHLRERAEFIEKYREADEILKGIEWVEGGNELRKGLDEAKNLKYLKPIEKEIRELNQRSKEILSVYDDEEIRNLIKTDMERAEKEAVFMKGMENIFSTSFGNEVFQKSYSGWIREVCGFELGGKAYILVGGNDKKLHVYGLSGNELFEKSYAGDVLSVYGFESEGKAYILAGGYDKKLHVYNENGNEIFEKSYSEAVLSVYGFESEGNVYILAGGYDKKLHVYDESGNEIFEKTYSEAVLSAHGFEANGRAYIFAGGYDKKLHVYNENGNEIFEKSYSGWIWSLHGFESGDMAYIIAGGNDKKLHVYDESGNEIFEKSYSGSVWGVHGFESKGRAYILAGGHDKKLHIYDENGNEIFEKSYVGDVLSVHGFEYKGKVYILAGGNDKKLHIYTGADTTTILYLQRWAERVGIKLNFHEIMKISLSDPEKAMDMAENLIIELEGKKKEYGVLQKEWKSLTERFSMAGLSVGEMPVYYMELNSSLQELKSSIHNSSISLSISGDITENLWSKAEITVKNDGDINLEDVEIEIKSKAIEYDGLSTIKTLKKGEEKKLPIRIYSKGAGYVPIEVLLKFKNPLTEQQEEKRIFPEVFVKEKGVRSKNDRKKKARAERHIDIPNEEEEADLTGVGDYFSYTTGEHLGSGGFSDVYMATDENGEEYAMKLPLNVDLTGNKTFYLPEKLLSGFVKEARIWNTLTENSVPGIVELYGFGIRPFPWFVMEYMPDGSLRKRIGKNGMDVKEAVDIAVKVLNTLYYIHHYGIVHRDIKPENVLLNGDEVKLTDFGLGKALGKASKSSQGFSGTIEYSAPEQLSKRKYGSVDWRTDIYQVGAMLYEMLSGSSPFEGDDLGEVTTSILIEEPEVVDGIDERLNEIVMKALSKKKEERWQGAMEMKKSLLERSGEKNRGG